MLALLVLMMRDLFNVFVNIGAADLFLQVYSDKVLSSRPNTVSFYRTKLEGE